MPRPPVPRRADASIGLALTTFAMQAGVVGLAAVEASSTFDPLRPVNRSELYEFIGALVFLAALGLTLVTIVLTLVIVVQWARARPTTPRAQQIRTSVFASSTVFVITLVTLLSFVGSDTPAELKAEAARLRSGAASSSVTVDGMALTPASEEENDIFFPGCRLYHEAERAYVWCPDGHRVPSFGGTADRTSAIGDGWYVLH